MHARMPPKFQESLNVIVLRQYLEVLKGYLLLISILSRPPYNLNLDFLIIDIDSIGKNTKNRHKNRPGGTRGMGGVDQSRQRRSGVSGGQINSKETDFDANMNRFYK